MQTFMPRLHPQAEKNSFQKKKKSCEEILGKKKNKTKTKNCQHFYCHWSHLHPQSIHRAVSNASPHLGPSQRQVPS